MLQKLESGSKSHTIKKKVFLVIQIPLLFHINLELFVYLYEKEFWFNLYINLRKSHMLAILSLPIYEQGLPLNIFRFSFISLISVLKFRFIPKYFTLLDLLWMLFFKWVFNRSLLVYTNMTKFWVLNLETCKLAELT